MKNNLLFFIFLAFGSNLYCQPPVKIFAFEQDNLPGTIPARSLKDENGNSIKKAAAKINYFVFLSFKKAYDIRPVQLFIKGKSYAIQSTVTRDTPVEYIDNTIPGNPEKTVLVPKTQSKVIQLITADTMTQKKTAYVQKLTRSHDVVITYIWNKRTHFITLRKMKKLKPQFNE
jgi:hypothetical protein